MDPNQLRIFVIEDNLGDVLLIQEALNVRGIKAQVQVSTDGEQALTNLSLVDPLSPPDLMIIDLNLPRISGMALLEKVREADKFEDTAVMVLTSSQSPQDRVEAERLGADAFVSKPLTLDDFLNAVGGAVEQLLKPKERLAHRLRAIHRGERRRLEYQSTGSARASSRG